ncbi:hypothetical protein PFISCL1PPCAC_16914, partial [Pristionchus fissidentatus]
SHSQIGDSAQANCCFIAIYRSQTETCNQSICIRNYRDDAAGLGGASLQLGDAEPAAAAAAEVADAYILTKLFPVFCSLERPPLLPQFLLFSKTEARFSSKGQAETFTLTNIDAARVVYAVRSTPGPMGCYFFNKIYRFIESGQSVHLKMTQRDTKAVTIVYSVEFARVSKHAKDAEAA